MTSRDPRPDLAKDAALWESLLAEAATDEADPNGLYGVLVGFRACGGQLVTVDEGGLAIRPGELGEAYVAYRQRWLKPHRIRLVELLKKAPVADQLDRGATDETAHAVRAPVRVARHASKALPPRLQVGS